MRSVFEFEIRTGCIMFRPQAAKRDCSGDTYIVWDFSKQSVVGVIIIIYNSYRYVCGKREKETHVMQKRMLKKRYDESHLPVRGNALAHGVYCKYYQVASIMV